jgi:hypothetical protein
MCLEPSFLTFIVAALAVGEILEIWRHSSLLARWRAYAELMEGFLGDLLRCPFCMAPWAAAAVCLCLGLAGWIGCCTRLVIWAFAVARLSNLLNDVFHAYCRTPKTGFEPPGEYPSAGSENHDQN